MKYNATPLLSSSKDSFLSIISPTDEIIEDLKQHRREVRRALRATFGELRDVFESDSAGRWQLKKEGAFPQLAEQLRKLNSEQKGALALLEPKFMSQGSFVYETLNLPCHQPPQQIDLDDGVYLPLDMFRASPIISKDLFFDIVDSSLSHLALMKGWQFEKKNTCARLVVDDLIHIDVPLYAVPLDRFVRMEESVGNESIKAASDTRVLLDKDDVYLAVRDKESWINSDPATISEWFTAKVKFHGEILRNVCRHLKAWRDKQFKEGGPSSIALMACAVDTFDTETQARHGKFKPGQESEALMLCAKHLKDQLGNVVKNPVDSSKPDLYPAKYSEQEVENHITIATNFANTIDFSLKKSPSKKHALDSIRDIFGSRVPDRIDLIITADDVVLSNAAKTTPAPVVPNGEAG
ncbi:CBASS cGAMP synthase [Vibrio rotiferianus]|uniref:CBASS cGAMP synthase n=1 Tax=Vibrio rotiferianus TaxID=190895 RepID=UPI00406A5954